MPTSVAKTALDGPGLAIERGLRSPDEESNGYASDLRLGRNFHREVDHFRYVLPGLFRRGARRQVEARAEKSAWACSMASGYAWVLSCTATLLVNSGGIGVGAACLGRFGSCVLHDRAAVAFPLGPAATWSP